MLYLAITTNNSLVVDDYYRQGKGINQRIERDRKAALLGLHATLQSAPAGLALELNLRDITAPASPANASSTSVAEPLPDWLQAEVRTVHASFIWPDKLLVRWIHVTQAERDSSVEFLAAGGGRYVAGDISYPQNGKWRVHVEPVANGVIATDGENTDWRLVSELTTLEPQQTLNFDSKGTTFLLSTRTTQ